MKKILFVLLALVLSLSISAMVVPAMAASSLVVNSDTSVKVVKVYNEASGSTPVTGAPLPFNAVLAAEPADYPTVYAPDAVNSVWDTGTGNYFTTNYPDAHWIWETTHAEDPATVYAPISPLYDPDASKNGRVVVFQKTFDISGTPQSAMLHIAEDNCYEVWINGNHVALSGTATAGWETSNLHEGFVHTSGWQNVGHYDVSSFLVNGTNTIEIRTANEYYATDDGNSPVPAYQANPYKQYNPAGLIFAVDVQSVVPPVPELPAGILFGLGILGIGGFIIIRRYRAAAASR